MKVLHIINSLATGGAEKLILDTLPLYNEQGIEADLLVLNGTDHPFLKLLAKKNCCNIFRLGKTSPYNPMCIYKIIPFLKKYDLVHVHLFPAQYFVVLAKIISGSKTKLIFTEHCTSNRRLRHFWFRIIDKRIYKFYNKVICITPEIKKILETHTGFKGDKWVVIENGVNLEIIESAGAIERKKIATTLKVTDKILIQVAGFRLQKDPETLIKALVLLPENFKLILVGEGETKQEVKKFVNSLNLNERVSFLGVRMDVPNLLKSADFVVLSTFFEGFGLAGVEGMAAGKPLLASDVPGLRETVKGAGILFPAGNEKILAEEILRLSTDKTYHDQIVAKCVERAQDFDITKMVGKQIALYRSLK